MFLARSLDSSLTRKSFVLIGEFALLPIGLGQLPAGFQFVANCRRQREAVSIEVPHFRMQRPFKFFSRFVDCRVSQLVTENHFYRANALVKVIAEVPNPFVPWLSPIPEKFFLHLACLQKLDELNEFKARRSK